MIMTREGLRHGIATEFDILFELIARHKKAGARRVEAGGVLVRRQFAHRDRHAQQFPQRVAILSLIQPAHRNDALCISEIPSGHDHGPRQILQKIRLRIRHWLFLLFRRHLARIQRIEHLLPAFGIAIVGDRERQIIDTELPFLLFRAVA